MLKSSKVEAVGLVRVGLETSVGEVTAGEGVLEALTGLGEIGGERVFLYGLVFWSLFVED